MQFELRYPSAYRLPTFVFFPSANITIEATRMIRTLKSPADENTKHAPTQSSRVAHVNSLAIAYVKVAKLIKTVITFCLGIKE